jgi:DNA polymerase IV
MLRGMEAVILHVDMDAFFAAVEQRDRPELKGQPVVVGSPPDRRGVVSAASYEARRYGIHSAMPSREAGRRCPHAVFLPVDGKRYRAVSKQVFSIFERITPLVEPLSIDEAFLDVTGARGLFGDGPAIGRRIKRMIREETGLTASVGVAPNKFLAKLASELDKPDGLTVVPREPAAIADFLAPLPVTRIWGVGKATRQVLEGAGIVLVRDLQEAPLTRLKEHLGPHAAVHLKRLAFGRDERDIETEREEKSISHEHTFPEDCRDAELVRATLLTLAEKVAGRVRAADLYAARAHLKLRWDTFETLTRQAVFPRPCCDDFAFRRAAVDLLARQELKRPVRLIGFGVSGLRRDPAHQLELFDGGERGDARHESLSRSVDRIRREFGADSIRRAGG